MKKGLLRRAAATLTAWLLLAGAAAAVQKGRAFDPEKRSRFGLTVGQFSSIEGFVEETTRRLFEVTGVMQVRSPMSAASKAAW